MKTGYKDYSTDSSEVEFYLMFEKVSILQRSYYVLLHKLLPRKHYRTPETTIRRWLGISDKTRWANPVNIYEYWEERTKMLALWVPEHTSVMEFGCGNAILHGYLPKSCLYIPSDIVKRNENTLVIDLNQRNELVLPYHDVFFFSGVLEYVVDLERFVKSTAKSCRFVITSYVPCDNKSLQAVINRRSEGWVNDYSQDEFCDLFLSHGFNLVEKKTWQTQILFLFKQTL